MKKAVAVFVCLLFLASALGMSAVVIAPPPDKCEPWPECKGGEEPPPPTGTIYYGDNDGSGYALWKMNADGSEKTKLPVLYCEDDGWTKLGKLSRLKHNDHYWIVRFCGVEGLYPDGQARRELFAVRDDNAVSLQLTNDPDIQPEWYRRNLAWGPDDVSISWGAKRWVCDPDCTITEFGIYDAAVVYDAAGDIVGLDAPVLIWDTGYVFFSGRYAADMQHLDWSPDGNRMVFMRMSMGLTLHVVDFPTSTETYLTDGEGPMWSPDGSKIAFVTDRFSTGLRDLAWGNYRLGIVDVGTGEVEPVPGFENGKHINPQWSGDGSDLYFISDQNGIANIYRVNIASGEIGQVTNLLTGVSGITELSPAMSMATAMSMRLIYCIPQQRNHQVRHQMPCWRSYPPAGHLTIEN